MNILLFNLYKVILLFDILEEYVDKTGVIHTYSHIVWISYLLAYYFTILQVNIIYIIGS